LSTGGLGQAALLLADDDPLDEELLEDELLEDEDESDDEEDDDDDDSDFAGVELLPDERLSVR